MTGTPQFADISAFQPINIDWKAYRAWAAQWDGKARVSMRSSYGVGYIDVHFAAYRQGALAAGIDIIIYYHYGYPEYNATAADEADWQHKVVGAIRPQDVLMLDYEEGAPQANAAWAYAWLARQEANYGGKLPTIYASDAYIRQRLQDSRLARYPLTLANWQFTPEERPACPPPWSRYTYLQYTDRATNIPGIAGAVDANIYLGGDEHTMSIAYNTPGVAAYFTESSPGWWLCKNGKTVHGKILEFYQLFGAAALCGLTYLGLPETDEIALDASGATKQYFERGCLVYDPQHKHDNPPGAGLVYLAHVYGDGAVGEDPLIPQLQAQLAQALALDQNVVKNRLQAIELEAQKMISIATAPF